MRKRFWASVALSAAVLVAGCAGGGSDDAGEATLTIYVSLSQLEPDGSDAADGARMALDEAGSEAAGVPVEAMFFDDMPGGGDGLGWSPAEAATNARVATQDSTAIAYLGEFESGATRASLPITNSARLLQVSPASAAEDLVAVPGTNDLPEAQPTGERSFGRVIPSDSAQAEAAAGWVDELGVRRVATQTDGSGFGEAMVAAFERALGSAALVRGGAELVYYGGTPELQPAALTRGEERLMVSDAELTPGVAELAGTLATSAALDPSQLPPAGREFASAFEAEYDRPPGRYAAYGYEAMAVILDSIERASDPLDRAAVIDAFLATTERASVLGTYSIDELGETTLERMTGYELGPGRPKPVARIGGAG